MDEIRGRFIDPTNRLLSFISCSCFPFPRQTVSIYQRRDCIVLHSDTQIFLAIKSLMLYTGSIYDRFCCIRYALKKALSIFQLQFSHLAIFGQYTVHSLLTLSRQQTFPKTYLSLPGLETAESIILDCPLILIPVICQFRSAVFGIYVQCNYGPSSIISPRLKKKNQNCSHKEL